MRKALTLIALAAGSLLGWSQSFTIDGKNYTVINDSTVEFTSPVSKTETEYVVPMTVVNDGKTYSVTRIGESAFSGFTNVEKITLPSTIKNFRSYAFKDCCKLKSLNIPAQLTTIGAQAFMNDSLLEVPAIPTSVKTINKEAFYNCGIKELTVPAGVNALGISFCQNAKKLEKVTFLNPFNIIPNQSFMGCSSLEVVILPKNLTQFGPHAFKGCSSLKSIDLPNTLVTIQDCAFQGCGLEKIVVPNSVKVMGASVFKNCRSLKEAKLSFKLTKIDTYTFDSCEVLNTLIIPLSVKSIESYAFRSSGLESMIVPKTVTTLGTRSFQFCTKLKSLVIESALTTLPSYLIEGCTSLENIILPPTLTKLNSYDFQDCAVKTLQLPAGITTIGSYCFIGSKIETLVLPKSTVSVSYGTFQSCKNLKTIYALNPTVVEAKLSTFNDTPTASATLFVPAAAVEAYKAADGWKGFGTIAALPAVKVNVTVSGNGTVEINGAAATTAELTAGDPLKLTLKPGAEDKVKSILVNDVDVTKDLVGNVYSVRYLIENTNVTVTFSGESGVEDLTDYVTVATEWYNLNGLKVKAPADPDGNIYIKVSTLSNGKVKTQKIINR